ncbi:MAG: aminoglycoside phosphotransferase [Alphaproteobacteria bacterium]|nr:aminoglycoside phosphotransferase [Alphaproteobacteria bacterium]
MDSNKRPAAPSDRAERLRAFLAAHGWDAARRTPLVGDASFRRYERLAKPDGSRAMLMDAPPPKENVRPFVGLARHLVALGFSAPRVLAEDADLGALVLEDLGDETFTRALTAGAAERPLYELATDVLIALHRLDPAQAAPKGIEPYSHKKFLDEAMLLFDWYYPAVTGQRASAAAQRDYVAAWLGPALSALSNQPPTLVLRDFHVDNLMIVAGRAGIARCGLLDFQDALAGPAAYDLMSLLEDARRDIAPELVRAMLDRYLAAFPALDRRAFESDFAILAAQRHAKVIGIFTRLCMRDSKPDYLVHVPRLWRLLGRHLGHPALGGLKDWLAAHLPPDKRVTPPGALAGRGPIA